MTELQSTYRRPNIVLVLADDMGFSDLGCYGSEINTPNIDALASAGVRFSQMYNCARCCPSRASLLTGVYPHQAGIGHMVGDLGSRSYQGYLPDDCVTIAEVLRTQGYHTLLSGKWHVGGTYSLQQMHRWSPGSPGHPTPLTRGFEEFYGTLEGDGNYFNPHTLMENDRFVHAQGDDYYYTHAISDHAVRMIDRYGRGEDPFFLYLAYTAPHWPLHALPDDIARYDSVYRIGWDGTRAARHESLLAAGLLEHKWGISPRDPEAPPWDDVREQEWQNMRMAVYAAQIDAMDQGIGRVLAKLRELGIEDDTLIFVLSDNGGSAEFLAENGHVQYNLYPLPDGSYPRLGNYPDRMPGPKTSYMSYGLPWANASNTPFRLYKHWVHEGGIATPCIVRWPRQVPAGCIVHEPAHFIDITATCLHAAGAHFSQEH